MVSIVSYSIIFNYCNCYIWIASNKGVTLLSLLKKGNVNRPIDSVIVKIMKDATLLNYACMDVDKALYIYEEMKLLPKSFTCAVIEKELNIQVNGPVFGDSKPFLLSGNDKYSRPIMIKLLRVNPDSLLSFERKQEEIRMEIEACRLLNLNESTLALVKEQVVVVHVPLVHANEVGCRSGDISAIIMPRYTCSLAVSARYPHETLLRQGRRLFEALEFIHAKGLVHMDVKADNVFVDTNGDFFLGDFGSCKFIGDEVSSSTNIFYHSNLNGCKAHPKIDLFMFLVMLTIESFPNKNLFQSYLYEDYKTCSFISREKLESYVLSLQDDLGRFLQDILLLHDDEAVNTTSI